MRQNGPGRSMLVQLLIFIGVFELLAWGYYAVTGEQMFIAALAGALGAWLGGTWWQRRKLRAGENK